MNPLHIEEMIKERQRETEAEAKRQQLIAVYDAHNPSPAGRMRFTLSTILIRLGKHLKRLYAICPK